MPKQIKRLQIKYSLVIPALNEETIIGPTLKKIEKHLKRTNIYTSTEVIVVAANGGDKTAEEAKKYSKIFARFKLIQPGVKVGKGRDVKAGVLASKGDYIIFTDADLATPASHITLGFKTLENGADMIIGTRNLSTIHSGFRKFVSLSAHKLTRMLIAPEVHDTQCGFKGFNKKSAGRLFEKMTVNGWAFDMELIFLAKKYKMKVIEVEINDWSENKPPSSQLAGENSIKATAKTFLEVLKIRFNYIKGRYN